MPSMQAIKQNCAHDIYRTALEYFNRLLINAIMEQVGVIQ